MIIQAGALESVGQRPVLRCAPALDAAKWRAKPTPQTVRAIAPPEAAPNIQPNTPSRPYADIYLTVQPRTVSGVTVGDPVAVQDRNIRTTTFAVAVSDFYITKRTNVPVDDLVLTTDHPSIATVSEAKNRIVWQSNGNTVLRVTYEGELLAAVNVTMSTLSSSSYDTLESFVTGTLAHHCENAVNSRIANATAAMLPIFSTQDHANQAYVRNTACWCYDLRQKMTCISPWNSTGANTRAVTLLAPDVVGMVPHYPASVGATVRFVTADNAVVTRTITKVLRHPNYVPYYPELMIGLLDSPVPNSITPCKVLPASYASKLPSGPKYIAALCLDQEEKALVTDLNSFQPNGIVSFIAPNLPYEQVLYEDKIVGDSGNPAFLIVNGELVLLTMWTWGGAGSGTFITEHIPAVNAMMATIGSSYTLSEVDLSSFP